MKTPPVRLIEQGTDDLPDLALILSDGRVIDLTRIPAAESVRYLRMLGISRAQFEEATLYARLRDDEDGD